MNKSFLLVAATLGLATVSQAQPYIPYLVGGIGYEQLQFDGVTYDGDFNVQGSVTNKYSDTTLLGDASATFPNPYAVRVTQYWDGSNLSSVWDGTASLIPTGSNGGFINGSATGEGITTPRRLSTSDALFNKNFDTEGAFNDIGVAFKLGAAGVTSTSFVIDLSPGYGANAWYDLTQVKFSGLSSAAPVTINWLLSTDNVSAVATGVSTVVTGSTILGYTADLSGVAALVGGGVVTLVAQFQGAEGSVLGLDNVQFIGLGIPEPVTIAGVFGALAVAVLARRRKIAAL